MLPLTTFESDAGHDCIISTAASCKIFWQIYALGVPVNEKATGSKSQPLRNGAIDQLPDRCLLRHNYCNKSDAVNCLVITVMSGCRKQMWLTMSGNIENIRRS